MIYGKKYSTFLAPYLYTAYKWNRNCEVTVYWSDLPKDVLSRCREAFPKTNFIETFSGGETHKEKVLHRIKICQQAVRDHCGKVAITDSDMLTIRPISECFVSDVVFTWRENHYWPLNAAVLLLNKSEECEPFVDEWLRITIRLLEQEDSTEIRRQFGSCDQCALWRMLNCQQGIDRQFTRTIGRKKYQFQGFPCKVLNEVNCNFGFQTRMFHYKGGWRDILLEGKPFPKTGPRAKCKDAYLYWNAMQDELQDLGVV